MQKNLGILGESTFKSLCASVGLVANKSEQDEFGWDYIVEFPYENQNISLDMCQPIECKVQVKATDHQKRKLSIKVSVLDRLVKSPNPTFIIFLEFDESTEVQSIFLRHIDKEIIEKTLKRSRELLVKNRPLHKSTIQIHYDKYKLSDNKGSTLKEAMKSHISHGMAHYIKEKQHFLKTLGFEGSFGSMQLTFNHTSLDELMDISLGLTDIPLKVKSIDKYTQIRFGIELSVKDKFFQNFDIKNAKFTISNIQGKEAKIIFVDEDENLLKEYSAKIIPSPFSTKKYKKAKVDTDIFYFTMSSRQENFEVNDFQLKFDYFDSTSLLLSDILKYYQLFYQISNSSKKVFQKLILNDNVFSMLIEKESLEPEIITTYKIANRLRKILNKMNIYHDIALDINDLNNNRIIINSIYNVFFEKKEDINISFTLTEKKDFFNYKAVIYLPFILTLNKKIYGGWLVLYGFIITLSGYEYKANIETITCVKEQFNLSNLNPEFFNKKFNNFLTSNNCDNDDNIVMLNLQLIPNIKEN